MQTVDFKHTTNFIPPTFTPQRLLNTIKLPPTDWIGLRVIKTLDSVYALRDENPQQQGSELSHGGMVEVLVNGQLGYGATALLTPQGIQAAAIAAYRQAVAASEWQIHRFPPTIRPRVTGHYPASGQTALDLLSPQDITDRLREICQTLKVSEQIVQTLAVAVATERESWFVSTNGSDLYQQFLTIATHYSAIAKDGSIVQKRSDNGYFAQAYQIGWEILQQADLLPRVQRVGEQAVELLNAKECPDRTTTLVLAPDQMLLQIHESIGHPLELDRILGDERNYAGESFVKPQDFGTLRYGSDLMNVTFDPTVPGEFASYPFDDTGNQATKTDMIRNGILQRGLGSLESQHRLGIPGVANARVCSWNRPPIDRIANLNLEPGTTGFAEMIGTIEDGVYFHTNRSWSIDDRRYKFQFGCEYAQQIENGQITKTLCNPNYRATTPQFWQSLIQVGDGTTQQTFASPVCGKGEPNQAIGVGHRSPICAFADIEIFGGG